MKSEESRARLQHPSPSYTGPIITRSEIKDSQRETWPLGVPPSPSIALSDHKSIRLMKTSPLKEHLRLFVNTQKINQWGAFVEGRVAVQREVNFFAWERLDANAARERSSSNHNTAALLVSAPGRQIAGRSGEAIGQAIHRLHQHTHTHTHTHTH